jgi:hypothetical protein
MTQIENLALPQDELETIGLTTGARDRVMAIAGRLSHLVPPLIAAGGEIGGTFGWLQIDPKLDMVNAALAALLNSPPISSSLPLETNALLGFSKLALLLGAGSIAVERYADGITQQAKRKGEQPIGYRMYSAIYDHTNEIREGGHLGDFTQEFYRTLNGWKKLRKIVEQIAGPMSEFVTENVPVPPKVPQYMYLRTPSLSKTEEFLKAKAHAQNIVSALGVFLQRAYTVFDPRTDSHTLNTGKLMTKEGAQIDFDNMCRSIDDIRYNDNKPPIRRFAIVNDRLEHLQALAATKPEGRIIEEESLAAVLEEKEYEVINAETTVMDSLLSAFIRKEYKRILVFDDGSTPGGQIASQFLTFYDKYRDSYIETRPEHRGLLPKFVSVRQEVETASGGEEIKLIDAINKTSYDAMFFIGEDDHRVVQKVELALQRQRNHTYAVIKPIEVLVEGRGSDETIRANRREIRNLSSDSNKDKPGYNEARQQQFNTHYVHTMLVHRYIELLLKDRVAIDWEKKQFKILK